MSDDSINIDNLCEFEQAQIAKSMGEACDLAQEAWDNFCYETLTNYPDMETAELQFLYAVKELGGEESPTGPIVIRDWNSFTKSITNSLLACNNSGYEIVGFDDCVHWQPKTVLKALGMEKVV